MCVCEKLSAEFFYAPTASSVLLLLTLSLNHRPTSKLSAFIPESKTSLGVVLPAGAAVEEAPRRLSRRCIGTGGGWLWGVAVESAALSLAGWLNCAEGVREGKVNVSLCAWRKAWVMQAPCLPQEREETSPCTARCMGA